MSLATVNFKQVLVTALFISLPFLWINLGGFIGLTFKPLHLVTIFIILYFLLLNNNHYRFIKLLVVYRYIILSYTLYLSTLLIALIWTDDLVSGLTIIIKKAFYFIAFIFIAESISNINTYHLAKIVYRIIPITIILFFGFASWIFLINGRNFFADYLSAVMNADYAYIMYNIYSTIFNYHIDNVMFSDDRLFQNLRNDILGAFVLFFILIQAYKPVLYSKQSYNITWFLSSAVCLFIVLTGVSRSNILALFLSFTFALILIFFGKKMSISFKKNNIYVILFIYFLVIFFVFISTDYLIGIYEMTVMRLSELNEDTRFYNYRLAIELISESPVIGHGINTTLSDTLRVHNFNLAAWVEGGILALLSSMIFILIYITYWAKACYKVTFYSQYWRLSVNKYWITTLPIYPLLNSQVFGSISSIGWVFLSFYCGVMIANNLTIMSNHSGSGPHHLSISENLTKGR